MDRQKIFEAISSHLVSRGVEGEKVKPESDLMRDLGLDSLDTVEMTLALEEQFEIEIPDSDLEDVSTVNDAIDLIERKLAPV